MSGKIRWDFIDSRAIQQRGTNGPAATKLRTSGADIQTKTINGQARLLKTSPYTRTRTHTHTRERGTALGFRLAGAISFSERCSFTPRHFELTISYRVTPSIRQGCMCFSCTARWTGEVLSDERENGCVAPGIKRGVALAWKGLKNSQNKTAKSSRSILIYNRKLYPFIGSSWSIEGIVNLTSKYTHSVFKKNFWIIHSKQLFFVSSLIVCFYNNSKRPNWIFRVNKEVNEDSTTWHLCILYKSRENCRAGAIRNFFLIGVISIKLSTIREIHVQFEVCVSKTVVGLLSNSVQRKTWWNSRSLTALCNYSFGRC